MYWVNILSSIHAVNGSQCVCLTVSCWRPFFFFQPTSPTPSTKEGNIPAPKGKGTLCCYCGFSSGILNKCERCGRLINNGKIVDIRHGFHSPQNSKVSPPVSKESFYGAGNRRTKVRRQLDNPPARQSRPKFEEPQCVTLSSDEDVDETQVISPKKLKEDHLVESSAVIESHTINKVNWIFAETLQLTWFV